MTCLGLLVGISWPLRLVEAASPTTAARKCRAAIGAGGRNVVGAGLTTIDACHARRDKGKFSGDCNVIPSGAVGFARAQARAEATIGSRCPAGSPVLANYPDGVAGIFPAVKELLEASGSEVQGAPDIAGDPSTRKARSKCHKAIGKARSGVVKEIVKKSTVCQKKLDKQATDFGPLDASCVASPAGSLGKGRNLIGKGCGGVLGADVGSCDPLPDCVLTDATASGQVIAKAIYSNQGTAEQECGDGVPEGTEECDDGNRDDADACRNNCTNAVCGDGVIASPTEECDDSNAVANDGCTNCIIDGATCGANGVDVIVSLVFEATNLNNLGGLIVNLGYDRAGVGIPGSADAQSVLDRVQDLTGRNAATFNDQDTNSDAVDDNLLNLYAIPEPITPGPFEQVRFDCTSGAFIRPSDFDCDPVNPSDTTGNPLTLDRDRLNCRVTQVLSAGAIPATTTTQATIATTSTTIATTTTQPGPTTTTTTVPHVCGDNSVQSPTETCDDGNTVDETTVDPIPPDPCPAGCRIETCNAPGGTLALNVDFSSTSSIAGYKVFIDYPEAKVSVPGVGQPGAGVITNDPTFSATGNDLDYGVIVVAGGLSAIPQSRLFTLNFTRCGGAAVTAGEFQCFVKQASDPTGNDVPMTCSVSIP